MDLEYDLAQSHDKISDLEYDMDKLSDEYDTLKDDNAALDAALDAHRMLGKDITDILLRNMHNVLKHIDTHHPEIMFELLAMPELCSDINLNYLMDDYVFQYSRTVYNELHDDILGPQK